jgi:hypothetical protein
LTEIVADGERKLQTGLVLAVCEGRLDVDAAADAIECSREENEKAIEEALTNTRVFLESRNT